MSNDDKKKPKKPQEKFEDQPLVARIGQILLMGAAGWAYNEFTDATRPQKIVGAVMIYLAVMGAIAYQFAIERKRRGGTILPPTRPGQQKRRNWFDPRDPK